MADDNDKIIKGPWENKELERQNQLIQDSKSKDIIDHMADKYEEPAYECKCCGYKVLKTQKDPGDIMSMPLLIASENQPAIVMTLVCPKCRSLQIQKDIHDAMLKALSSNIITPPGRI